MSLSPMDLFNLVATIAIIVMAGFAIRRLFLREQLIKAQAERIKGNGKCDGVVAVPESATLLVATDETDGGITQGQIFLKDKNLYIANTFLWGDTKTLCSYLGGAYLRISLADVAYAKAENGLLTFGLPDVPCEAALCYNDARLLKRMDKLGPALKENLPCPLDGDATFTPTAT